jgi:hypothetical protein
MAVAAIARVTVINGVPALSCGSTHRCGLPHYEGIVRVFAENYNLGFRI